MLLKSIKLENFRQFRNESIDFAQGEGGLPAQNERG